jgi:hypothetical protein
MPIDGGTGNVKVKVGNNVARLTVDVVTINQTEPTYVTFAVAEARRSGRGNGRRQGTFRLRSGCK